MDPVSDHSAVATGDVTVAVLLAAGGGSRFTGDGHKLHAVIDGRSVALRSLDTVLTADIGPVVVVTGAVSIADPTRPADHPPSVERVVHNPRWADGQATSLQVAIRAATELGAEAVVVGLADQPFISAEAWRRVAESESPIAVATYDGSLRNPVRLHRSVWHLLPTAGDAGARFLIRLHPELVERVPCPGSPADIDTLEDLRQWQSRSSTNSS